MSVATVPAKVDVQEACGAFMEQLGYPPSQCQKMSVLLSDWIIANYAVMIRADYRRQIKEGIEQAAFQAAKAKTPLDPTIVALVVKLADAL